jgi:hypothetical protein
VIDAIKNAAFPVLLAGMRSSSANETNAIRKLNNPTRPKKWFSKSRLMTPAPWNVSTTGKFVFSTTIALCQKPNLGVPSEQDINDVIDAIKNAAFPVLLAGMRKLGFWHSAIAFDSTGAEITSCGILIKLAPFLPDVAVLIAL